MATLMSIQALPKPLQENIHNIKLEIIVREVSALTLQLMIFNGMKDLQEMDPTMLKLKEEVLKGSNTEFKVSSDEILHFKDRLCVPNDKELKSQILSVAHATLLFCSSRYY